MSPLSPKRRSELRGEAHGLGPVVLIGDKGLTDEVIAEIDRALKAHELIKVRAAGADREARAAWLDTICARLEAAAVQQIGKIFVIYRENPPDEGPKAAAPAAPRSGADRLASGREKQRLKDEKKRRERDIEDMRRKGKIPATAKLGPGPGFKTAGVAKPRSGARDDQRTGAGESKRAGGRGDEGVKRTARPRSRTPSPLPESGPRRRRPRTSR